MICVHYASVPMHAYRLDVCSRCRKAAQIAQKQASRHNCSGQESFTSGKACMFGDKLHKTHI